MSLCRWQTQYFSFSLSFFFPHFFLFFSLIFSSSIFILFYFFASFFSLYLLFSSFCFFFFLLYFFFFSFPVFDLADRVFEAISYATSYVRASNKRPDMHPRSIILFPMHAYFGPVYRYFHPRGEYFRRLVLTSTRPDWILDERRYLRKANIKYVYSRGV